MAELDLGTALRYLDGAEGWASYLSQDGVDWLSHVVLSTHFSHVSYSRGVRRLRRLCRETGLVPTSCKVPLAVVADSSTPFSQTAFSDVWSAMLEGRRVAVKALRLHGNQVSNVQRAYLHELIMWLCLRHPNIVPFIGTSEQFPVSLVSEWMSGGTVTAFLVEHPDWDRSFLMIDILQGLGFMHSLDVVHGDLKPDNVLVDFQGRARLADFGLAITLNATIASVTLKSMGTPHYMAPELFEDGRPAKASDVYALAMTSWHIYSGVNPFPELSSSFAVARRVLAGRRPSRTEEMNRLKLTNVQWQSIVAAWDQEPSRRPALSPEGEPMIYSWSPETDAVRSAGHHPDLHANDALRVLLSLSLLMRSPQQSYTLPQEFVDLFSFIVGLGRVPVRRHEGRELRGIYMLVRIKLEPLDWDSPYFKIFLLLQAHFSRLALSQELAEDLTVVLERVFSVFSACAHGTSYYEHHGLIWAHEVFPLMHMCVHGMRRYDPELKQIPYFTDDVIERFHPFESVRDIQNMNVHQRNKLLKMDAQQRQDVEAFLSSYPALSVTTLFLESDRLSAGKQTILEVKLRQTVPGAEGCQVENAHRYPRRHPVKWWVGVYNGPWLRRLWLAHEYVSVPKTLTIKLGFMLPKGTHFLSLYVNCDSYMGLEEDIDLDKIVVGS